MLRVVLADDERKVIFLLRELIDWDKLGYEIVGVAHDGLRALELVGEKKPHLLVTDIRMPGCSGIDLIRQAKEAQPDLHCIIISGYQEFEYARSALKYGVEDYLLKPVKKEELTNLLIRLRAKLGEEAQNESQRVKNDENRQVQFLRSLRQAAMTALRSETGPAPAFPDAGRINETYGLTFPAAGSFYAILVRPDIADASERADSSRILMRHTLDIVRRNIAGISKAYAAAQTREGVAAVLCSDPYDPAEVRHCMTRIRKEIEQHRDLFGEIRISISVGGRRKAMEELPGSMQEAIWLCADRIRTGGSGSILRDAGTEALQLQDHFRMDVGSRKALQEAAEQLDAEGFQKALRDSFGALRAPGSHSGRMVQEWFEEAVRVSVYGIEQNAAPDPSFAEDLYSRFWFCRTEDEALRLLEDQLGDRICSLRSQKTSMESRPITEAKKYIRDHFDEPLRLEDVSDHVGFNATYFSTLFKKETGEGFTDYLAGVRMDRAKDLLIRDDLPVMDICEMVGYKDLKYFSRLFKKITGISPSDYRKLYR